LNSKSYLNKITFFIILLTTSISFAQIETTTLVETQDNDTSRQRILELTTKPYVREREIIIRQLEIITGDEETKYTIVSGDTISSAFMDRGKKIKAVYQVSGNGIISLPLIGAIKVENLNRKQAREKINNALKTYIRYPNTEIFINVAGRYMVAGEVVDPGVFRLRPNITVMEAIIAAEFDRDEVNLKSVMVMRGSAENPVAKRLNLLKMVKKGDRSDNILVKPGDFIYVPKRFIANIEEFISTVYRYVGAYYGLGRIPGEPVATGGEPDKVFFE
jgi:polysaccharide export outer membrane protein